MQKKYLLFLAILLFTIQCRKDRRLLFCEEFPQDCVDIFTVKDHFFFDVGTYWVYEEETSGQLDSQWVSRAFTFSNVCWFDYDIKSSLNNHTSEIATELLTSAIDSGLVKKEVCIYITRSKYKPNKLIGNSVIAPFFYKKDISFYNGYGNLSFEDIMNNYFIEGVKYNFVLKVHNEGEVSEHKQSTNHYYAKYVGLIRKELIDSNQVWNLIRYNIVQ